ncbi:hypothetical protein BT96DRAFT_1007791 [Gymnopus androsaceus JB14]|uniref:RING-type domain-containing protein n=1 Tax=Gymnopus androsaceus JB14 TaxID=1447944 RepID=A0A6A4GGU0_9AGAR|nr:hypothetical protein BT96DRAFT_1007791 [Gymnopus androsaceus JB14]
MPSSTNPRLIASSRTAAAPYPPTIAGSSDTDDEVKNTRGRRRKVKSQATRRSARLQAISLPTQEEFEALKEKAELAQKQLLDLTAKRTEQFTCPICYGPPFQPYITQCGHIYCVDCINDLRSFSFVHANGMTECAVCRRDIYLEPVPCGPVQTLIHTMANAEGQTVPNPVPLSWDPPESDLDQ